MAKQKGSDMLLKIDTAASGGPTYTTVGGAQQKSLRLDESPVDVTNQDSTGKWQEMLAGAGIKKMAATLSGVFDDGASQNAVVTAFMAGTHKLYQYIVPGLGTFAARFMISSLDLGSNHDREVTFSMSIESTGEVTFTAES